jgi:DNA polymerase/3'-5' exonuclease PolX
MKNRELADLFEKMADILEFKGENPFEINAYRKTSRIIGDLTQDIKSLNPSLKPVKCLVDLIDKLGKWSGGEGEDESQKSNSPQ